MLKSQFSQKYTKIPVSRHRIGCIRSCPKPKIHFVSRNVTSISVDENSRNAHNSCQNLQNYASLARCHSGASGGVWDGVYAPRFRQPTHISFGNFRNQRLALTPENQGTHSRYLALDCKCAFGAIKKCVLEFPAFRTDECCGLIVLPVG